MKLMVTGGAGFIGSAVIRHLILQTESTVLNIDKLTYAANLDAIAACTGHAHYQFRQADICDREAMQAAFTEFQPDAILHLAAESHVDRSIDAPDAFLQTNFMGTYVLLEAARAYWSALPTDRQKRFKFHHVSTDEVYGSLPPTGLFTEDTPYQPNSPYSASKASSDHLVRAWHHTYGLPVVTTNCSNNYGPYQFPEKLIPLMIIRGLNNEPMPVYGQGENIRDWLHVDDHVAGLMLVLKNGKVGETYNIGGNNERTNKQVVETIADILDQLLPRKSGQSHRQLMQFVPDRPGHDFRYAIDASKIRHDLKWHPKHTFEQGIRATVQWYLDNRTWWQKILETKYQGQRLGTLPGKK